MRNDREKPGFSPINQVFQSINLVFRFEKPIFFLFEKPIFFFFFFLNLVSRSRNLVFRSKNQVYQKLCLSSLINLVFRFEKPGLSINSKSTVFDKPGFSIKKPGFFNWKTRFLKSLLFNSNRKTSFIDLKSRVFDKPSFSVEKIGFAIEKNGVFQKPCLSNLINLVFRFEKPGLSIRRTKVFKKTWFFKREIWFFAKKSGLSVNGLLFYDCTCHRHHKSNKKVKIVLNLLDYHDH